jgi:cell division protein FtsW
MKKRSRVASLRNTIVMPRLNRPDPWLLAATAGLVGLGVVMVFNATYFYADERFGDPLLFFRKQLVALAGGTFLLVVVSRLRLRCFEAVASPVVMLAAAVILACVLVPGIGIERNGARRWVDIGFFNLQPSEFVKIVATLYLARLAVRKRDRLASFADGILPPLLIVGFCAALIAAQPDLGTATILILLLGIMLFVGGARLTHLSGLAVAAGAVLVAAIVHSPYRWERLVAFRDPWAYRDDSGFQLVQSLIAFGAGGVAGVGFGESQQKMFFLPEAHTDFIFALVGEELGLIGALAVLGLFAIVGWRGFRIALRHPDPFASMLAFGITLVIVMAAVVNVGVVVGMLPTKGLALPFLSYGGSALIGAMMQVGILTALSRTTG